MPPLLELIQVVFIALVTFFIGWRVGREVPDEVVPAGKHISWGIEGVLLAMVAIALYALAGIQYAAIAAGLLLLGRFYFPLPRLYAPLSGLVLAGATLLPSDMRIALAVLALLGNFMLGAVTAKMRSLVRMAVWQPIVALAVGAALLLL